MKSKFAWVLAQLTRRIWFRVSLFGLLGVLSALVSIWVGPLLPEDISASVGADAVDKVLGIIASSMLTVAIFSLSTLVSAYSAAANGATPRATQLLESDSVALNALGTFIGAFLFSLAGIVALSTGVYGASGRLVMFGVTVLVIAFVVFSFIRWIDRLSRLGRMGETIDRVVATAAEAMRDRARHPNMGGAPARPVPGDAVPVKSTEIGYLQHIDMKALGDLAERVPIDVAVLPGSFVAKGQALAHVAPSLDEEACEQVRKAFTIGARRQFDQDPRFGVIVLTEIASRALSPAVNDAGTAIDVLAALVRVLAVHEEPQPSEGGCARVHLPEITVDDILDDCITPIARDGAGVIEVGLRLQRMLEVVADLPGYAEAARRHARSALARGLAALAVEEDRERLSRAAAWAASPAPRS